MSRVGSLDRVKYAHHTCNATKRTIVGDKYGTKRWDSLEGHATLSLGTVAVVQIRVRAQTQLMVAAWHSSN
jgi:hypothetical protein